MIQKLFSPNIALINSSCWKALASILKCKQVINVVLNPERVDIKGTQFLATKSISSEHAIRVVYEIRKGFLVIITFYPVRRERYDL